MRASAVRARALRRQSAAPPTSVGIRRRPEALADKGATVSLLQLGREHAVHLVDRRSASISRAPKTSSSPWLLEIVERNLTLDDLLEIHAILGADALDTPNAEGRLRTETERIQVVDTMTNHVWFVPPPARELPARLDAMLSLANDPHQGVTIASHVNSHRVSYLTARKDLQELESQGLLRRVRVGRTDRYLPTEALAARLSHV